MGSDLPGSHRADDDIMGNYGVDSGSKALLDGPDCL